MGAGPKIEPHRLDISGTCRIPPEYGGGDLWDAGEGRLEGSWGLESILCEAGPVWRAKPNTGPNSLDIDGKYSELPGNGAGKSLAVGEG